MSLRSCLLGVCLLGLLNQVGDCAEMGSAALEGKYWVYVGTYNSPHSRGIYRCEFDTQTGALGQPELAVEAVSPSFLAIHPNQKFLYAVAEVSSLKGKPTGGVSAYSIDRQTGQLTLLNQESCGGAGPCHLIVDRTGTHVLVANYSGGNAGVLPIDTEGKLHPLTSLMQHVAVQRGDRKKAPLAHSVNLDPSGRFAFVGDAGVDRVFIYRYDASKGILTPNDPPAGIVADDAAPRHFAMHPNGKQAYAINEAELSVTVFDFNPQTGALTPRQTISTVPPGVDRKGLSTAEVVVHPSGRFLYGSNRGHNTIAAFAIDPESGLLSEAGRFGGAFKIPRNFNVDPTGKFLLAAGQDSDNIVVYCIDQKTGGLTETGTQVHVGKPVCLKFYKR